MGPSRFSGEVWSAKDGYDLARRSCHILVVVWLGPSVTDVIPELLVVDEFLNLVFEHDALFLGVPDVLVISTVFVMVSLGAVSS